MLPEIKCGDLILKLDLGEPSDYAKEKAIRELRETPENIENGLKELRRLLKDEKDELYIPDTDEWLIRYLRRCKFYPESARDLIKNYYKMLLKYPETTDFLIPSLVKPVFDHKLVSILPQRDQCGRRILVSLSGKQWNPKVVKRDDVFAASTLCCETVRMEPETQINGVVFIMDMEGLSLSQTFQVTPYSIKRILDFIQDNIPSRVKGVHIVNQPRIFQPIFAAAKKTFSKKYEQRIFMHGSNYESLHQHISPECLPECYGGSLKSQLMYATETYELLSHFEQYFETMHSYGLKTK